MPKKSNPRQTPPITPVQPGEANAKSDRAMKSAAHLSDPEHRFHAPTAGHDRRPDAAAGLAPQRLRARQSEAR